MCINLVHNVTTTPWGNRKNVGEGNRIIQVYCISIIFMIAMLISLLRAAFYCLNSDERVILWPEKSVQYDNGSFLTTQSLFHPAPIVTHWRSLIHPREFPLFWSNYIRYLLCVRKTFHNNFLRSLSPCPDRIHLRSIFNLARDASLSCVTHERMFLIQNVSQRINRRIEQVINKPIFVTILEANAPPW